MSVAQACGAFVIVTVIGGGSVVWWNDLVFTNRGTVEPRQTAQHSSSGGGTYASPTGGASEDWLPFLIVAAGSAALGVMSLGTIRLLRARRSARTSSQFGSDW